MSTPTLQIPKDVIEPIIQANIVAAVAQAMGPTGRVLENAIAGILSTKVDSQGKPTTYGGSMPWIEWAVAHSVRDAAKKAIDEHVAQFGEAIKKQLVADLSKKNSPLIKALVDGLMSGVFKAESLRYRFTVNAE